VPDVHRLARIADRVMVMASFLKRWTGRAAVLLLCSAWCAGTGSAQPSAYGMVTHDLDADRARKMSELGAGFARVSVRWWQVEPSPGQFEWGALDHYVREQAAPRGIRLFLSLGEPPEWAGGGADHNRAPDDLDRWFRFVHAVVDRYKDDVQHWGVWNEPDSALFLDGRDAYRDLAREARRAIKTADPSGLVLGPEISEGALDDGWFAEIMTAWGFETFDIVTVHVYSTRVADKMDRLVFPWTFGKEVWLTEAGRSTSPNNTIGEELQRLYYWNALGAFESRRWWWTKIFFYDLYNWDGQSRFGIVRPDWTNTRAFSSLRDWIADTRSFDLETDTDGDALPDAWEGPLGFSITSSSGADGAGGDPDGDGLTNLEEYRRGTHPRGTMTRYLAEGSSTSFFDTSIEILNLDATSPARVLLRSLASDGRPASTRVVRVPASGRATVQAADLVGRDAPAFATVVESDMPIVVDRTMRWGGAAGGAHAETALASPATEWFLAEGATHSGFSLFYLLQNPADEPTQVQVMYLRPAPAAPLVRTYVLDAHSRLNIWVNHEDPALAATDLSASIRADRPIIVERAMYLGSAAFPLGAGHASAGVTSARTQWFLAEGATGTFFDLFLLIANPSELAADVRTTYLLPDGRTVVRTYRVEGRSRFTAWVDHEDPALADSAVSAIVESLAGVPIVVERAMWWPGPSPANWREAHNSTGMTETGIAWALAGGEQGGDDAWETFVLIANTGDRAGRANVTLHFENGATVTRPFDLEASSRTNVMIAAAFPEAEGRRFGVVVESLGPDPQPIVVERASYASPDGEWWRRGTNARATRLR
jgi:hypothetical protein